ncbi:MAG: hypothetical protein M3312_01195, partial [Actinomycetota bacterium]|nr:hypothetical protein [Actinomycetota bacterium]
METAARLAVGVVLLLAAAGKVRAWGDLSAVIRGYGFPARLSGAAAPALVLVEAALGMLLLAGLAYRFPPPSSV